MLFSLLRIFGLSAFFLLGALQAQVPQLLNFQGRIAVAGVNFDSTAAGHAGQFKFALVDGANPPVIYWSNDGSLTGQTTANAPTASVALPVVRGLYSVMLGDATLANMTAIPASVFSSHADVRLRVWFDDGINGFQLLVPDQRIAAVGYAVMAGNAAVAQTVVDGAITSAKLADGSVSSAKLAPDIAINGTTPSALGLALFGTPDATSARIALGLGSLALQDSTTIKLVPQTVPLNPAEGWLYADSTTHGLFYYNGTAWTQPYTTPAGLLTALQGVAGTGSGLDADLLRGTTPSGLGLSLLGAADAASGRTALGLGPVATVPGTPGTFGLTMLGTVDASAGRTALGLGSLALQNSTAITTPLGVPAGTAAAPTYTFGGDPDTGFYSLGPNQIGVSEGGTLSAAFYYGLLDFFRGGKVMRFDPQVGGGSTRAGITTDQETLEFTAGDLNGASPKLKLSATGVKIGDGTEITSTGATGAALLATATTTAARTALGLGSLAVQDATTIKLVPQAAPTNPVEGWLYADPVTHGLFYYNGTAWIQPFFQGATGVGSGLDADLVRGTTPSGLGLSLLGVADAASGRTALGLGPVATVPSTPGTFGLTMLGTVDASAGRTALGLGSLALQNSTAITTPLGVPAGTAAAPTYTFGGDPDTGFYSLGANQIGLSLGGTLSAAFYYGLLDFYRGGKVMRFDPQVGGNGTRAGITTDQATLEFTAGDVNGAGPKLKLSATGVKIGDGTEITSTGVTGAALVATTTASAARAALGLGPLAIEQGTPGAFGLTMLGTADAPAGRAALGLGSLALQDSAAVAAGRLELVPQAAPPNPAEGWLYLDSTTHGLYYYNGTAWIQPYSNDTFTGVLPTVALNENVAGQKAAVALASYQDDPAHSLLSLGINLTSSPSGTTTIQSGLAWGLALENNFTNAQGGSNHEFYLMDGGSHRPFGVNWSQPVSGNVSIVAGNVSCPSPHGLTAGQQFQFSSLVGASGVSPGTDYFVLPGGLTATQFTFSTSQGGSANDGSATSGTWQRGGHGSAYFGVPALVSVSDYTNAAYGGMTFVVRNTKESNPAVLLIENSGAGVGKKALLQMGYPGLTLQYDPQNTGADEFNLKTIDTHVLWKDVGGHIGLGIDLNAGIELGAKVEVGGQFAVATGTEEAPTYTFHGDLDTGFYSIGANRVGVSLGGTQAAAFFDNIFDLFRGGKRIRFDPQVGGGGTRAGITTDQATLEFTAGNLNGSVPKFKLSATGVSIGGGTEIASSGATGAALVEAATPGSARTALGLGSLATQDSTAIQLVPQGAPANPVEGWIYADSTTHGLAYYNGTAWTQPYTSPAGLLAALQNIGGSGSGLDADLVRGTTPSVFGLALLGVADAGASRTALGLGSLALQDSMTIKLEPRGAPANPVEGWIYADSTTHGLTYYNGTAWTQPYTSPAGLLAALQSVGGSGSGLDADLVRGTTPSVFGLALLGVADAGAGRTALGLGPVATVQGIPGALGLTLLGTTDAAAGRTALGLGSLVTQSADAVAITGGTISGLGSLGVSTGPLLADSPVTLASAWNAPAVVFTALKIDVTDTTSAAGSLLQDWQVGGMSKLGLRKDGTLLGPTNTTELALEAGGFGRLSYAGLPVVSWNQTAGWMFGSSIPMSWNNDLILGRDGAATLQLGQDAATTIPQTLKAHDGVGTDKDGADVTLAGGSGTGTGRGGAVQTATALSGATGGTQGALSTRTYQSARPTILTDSAATTIASITLANGKHLGGRLLVTVAAEDTTDFQVHSATLVFSAVNQGGVVVANISAESSATDAFTAGTLTTAWTIVQNGAAVNIKCNAASSLTGAVLTCKWIADLNSNDPAVVTPQ